jgi:hypothetical protein
MDLSVVLAGMPTKAKQTDLKFALEEFDLLEELCEAHQLSTTRPSPTKNQVISSLHDC